MRSKAPWTCNVKNPDKPCGTSTVHIGSPSSRNPFYPFPEPLSPTGSIIIYKTPFCMPPLCATSPPHVRAWPPPTTKSFCVYGTKSTSPISVLTKQDAKPSIATVHGFHITKAVLSGNGTEITIMSSTTNTTERKSKPPS